MSEPAKLGVRDWHAEPHHLWVVLPAYNEEGSLGPLLAALLWELDSDFREFTILVVNDGSTDGTAAVVRGHEDTGRVRLLDQPANRGLAETLRTGLLEAVRLSGPEDTVVVMDADNSHPAGLIFRMTRSLREGVDVVIASRYREGSQVRGLKLHRRLLSNGASWLFRVVFPTPGVRDYTCGYRAYRASLLKQLVDKQGPEFISERGFACMVDLLLRLREQGAIFSEVPLVLRYDRKEGASKMKVSRTIKETLFLMFRRSLGW